MRPFQPLQYGDWVMVAYVDLTGQPQNYRFSFEGLPLGSGIRGAKVAEYDRQIEALKGQGCKVGVFHPDSWARGYGRLFFRKAGISWPKAVDG